MICSMPLMIQVSLKCDGIFVIFCQDQTDWPASEIKARLTVMNAAELTQGFFSQVEDGKYAIISKIWKQEADNYEIMTKVLLKYMLKI